MTGGADNGISGGSSGAEISLYDVLHVSHWSVLHHFMKKIGILFCLESRNRFAGGA